MTVKSGAESERQRRREMMAGFIGGNKELASSIIDRDATKEWVAAYSDPGPNRSRL